jgi:hypothetical protein
MVRMKWLFQEPERDPALGAALRSLDPAAPAGEDDLLRQRIVAAARPTLGRLRSPAPRWWEWISRWMPVAVSAGVVAAFAAGLLLPSSGDLVSAAASTANAGADSSLVIAAFSAADSSDMPDDVAGSLVAPGEGDWLFQEAVSR